MTAREQLRKRQEDEAATREVTSRDRRIAKLEAENNDLKRKYKAALEEVSRAEACSEFISELGQARDPESWAREVKHGTSKATAIACASDWHVGEVVDRRSVNGLNEYDQSIATRRIRKFFGKIPEYVERYVPMAKELWLWAGGDFITGYIHPELVEANSMSPTQECKFWVEHWGDGLAYLRRHLPKLRIIIPTSIDNHGRTTEKIRVSTAANNSFTQLTYWWAQGHYKDPMVEWRIAEGYHNVQNIQGRLVRFHHGHAIRFQGGVGGLTIPARKAVAQWNKGQSVDLDVFGHHHTYMDGGNFITNGALIGYGAYSLQVKAEFQPPTQTFIVFDRKHGVRQVSKIFVDD